MFPRMLTFCLALALLTAGTLFAMREGWLGGWKERVSEMLTESGARYTVAKFRADALDQVNYARTAEKLPTLNIDPELDAWMSANYEKLDLTDLNAVTKQVQDGMPRYFNVSICAASSPSLRELLEKFHEYLQDENNDKEMMTHMTVAVRERAAGLMHEALLIQGRRLPDFTPEALTNSTGKEPFYSVCVHCKAPHFMHLSREQRSMALQCPKCARKYAVIASDSKGRFHYVNEFLTGYSPPAVFSKSESRIQQLFTIWSAVHENCRYTNDPGAKPDTKFANKEHLDAWQFADETQLLQKGDCEDSSLFLADWLMSRGYQVRVALGRYGDLGGHAWCVVKVDDKEYLLESTEGRPDPVDPPLASRVGSRYVPEVLFDRFAIYVPSSSNRVWKGDYWSNKSWVRIEPRSDINLDPLLATGTQAEKDKAKSILRSTSTAEAFRVGNALNNASTISTSFGLGVRDVPTGSVDWRMSRLPKRP